MPDRSAGILLYRRTPALEVWIAHMGGPLWARKDEGAWSIPKGLLEAGEEPLEAALREFAEETGEPAPDVDYELLGEFTYTSGKVVIAFTAESDFTTDIHSNEFELEWPPRSGRMQSYPEMDRARVVRPRAGGRAAREGPAADAQSARDIRVSPIPSRMTAVSPVSTKPVRS